MTNVNQAPLPRLSKAPLVRASLVKRRYIKYLAIPFFKNVLSSMLTSCSYTDRYFVTKVSFVSVKYYLNLLKLSRR